MANLPSNEEFYAMLSRVYAEVKQRIDGEAPMLVIFATTDYKGQVDIDIGLQRLGEADTKGKEIWAVAEEFQRRRGFTQAQARTLLAPPVVEHGPSGPTEPPLKDDEIPF